MCVLRRLVKANIHEQTVSPAKKQSALNGTECHEAKQKDQLVKRPGLTGRLL